MRLLCACLALCMAAGLGAGTVLQKARRIDASALRGVAEDTPSALDSDTASLDRIMSGETDTQSTIAPQPLENSGPSLTELLRGARWPSQEEWDQSFSAAVSGGTTEPCSAPLLGRYRLSPYGFGAHLNQFANEVVLAMYSGKPLALCAPPNVRDQWAVYFQDPGFGRCTSCDWEVGPRDFHEMGYDLNGGSDQSAMEDVKRYVYQKLFALRPEAQAAVDAGLQTLGAGSIYVGVHIRRGDKSQEVPPVPIEKYAEATKQMCSTVGTRTVFVASDDESARGQLQEQLGSDFSVLEQRRLSPDAYRLRGDAARSLPPPDGEEDEEKSVLVDVAALVRAAGFVGTASSNLGRLVFFQRGAGSPSVSLDVGGDGGFESMTR